MNKFEYGVFFADMANRSDVFKETRQTCAFINYKINRITQNMSQVRGFVKLKLYV